MFGTFQAIGQPIIDTVCVFFTQPRNYSVLPTSGSTYQWSVIGGTIQSGNGSASIDVVWGTSPGLFDLVVQETNQFGCVGAPVIAKILLTDEPPKVQVVGDTLVCVGDSVALYASGALNYKWSNGSTNASITVQANSTLNFWVIGSFDNCGNDTAYHDVGVVAHPVLDINPSGDNEICNNEIITLEVSETVDSLIWNDGLKDFVYPVETPGIYSVTAWQYRCSSTDSVEIFSCKGLFVPTIFSPNNDNNNDVLYIYGNFITTLEFYIYNQWSKKVFESTSQDVGWDGTIEGKEAEQGSYLYVLKVWFEDGNYQELNGNTTLVR